MRRFFFMILFSAALTPAAAQTCDVTPIPPKLNQARMVCSEAKPTTDEARAALAGCARVWEEYNRLKSGNEACAAAKLKSAIDEAVNSIPAR